MAVLPKNQGVRRGFTLVEMLVVVVIIGILASLITAAAMQAKRRARIAVITLEIAQLDLACKAFKERFGEYPPDGLDAAVTTRFVKKAFPPFTGSAPAEALAVTPVTALAYWLGTAFSADPTNPFGGATTSKIGPFFDFDTSRIKSGTYWPPGVTIDEGTTKAGYVYFRAENGGYTRLDGSDKTWTFTTTTTPSKTIGGVAMKDGRITPTPPWMNPNSFQIRACGMDGKWATSPWAILFGVGTNYKAEDYDDITNFSNGTLEDSLP